MTTTSTSTFVDDDDVFELTTGSTDALSQVPLAEGRLVVTAEGPQGRREMQVLSRELGMLSGVLPLDDRVVLLGDGALAVFDRRTGERLDPAPLLTTFRAYTAPWGGPSTLFELWLLACPLALFALLAAAALRGRLGALTLQRVALLAAVLNVCGLLSLVERVFHL